MLPSEGALGFAPFCRAFALEENQTVLGADPKLI
jgi:hypothetical protein